MATPLQVSVVSPEGVVWEGEAVSVLVRTTEGDVGILSNHEPFLAGIVPCGAEIVSPDGHREILAVEGGFISVWENRVSLLTDSASLARYISLDQARTELAAMHEVFDSGNATEEQQHQNNRLIAQVKAGEKYALFQD